ncbi:HAD-IA family hydrolase [Streptomyces cinereospinus]|uniref:HAD-IA family hydrolase n=1 Tax=Streptomyces cinereospinus TaxID=285561 RepID=A0ABV5NA00_9ACTN
MLGLPDHVRACLFGLDGVLTGTAEVHAAAWKETFDAFLRRRAGRRGGTFVPFDAGRDYDDCVDGRPREDGVRAFLASRGIALPEGTPDDGPDRQTGHGVGNRRNELLLRMIHEQGVKPYAGSVAYLRAARDTGLRRAVVSSSANCRDVLAAAGVEDLLVARVDGVTRRERGLRGKPAPDTCLAGARLLGVDPGAAAVFEDALAGGEAGRAGHFGAVVGVDRTGRAAQLRRHGADLAVTGLAQLLEKPR